MNKVQRFKMRKIEILLTSSHKQAKGARKNLDWLTENYGKANTLEELFTRLIACEAFYMKSSEGFPQGLYWEKLMIQARDI